MSISHVYGTCLGHIINLVVKALLFGKGVSKVERELAGASSEEASKFGTAEAQLRLCQPELNKAGSV
jgi:hypothetical protein